MVDDSWVSTSSQPGTAICSSSNYMDIGYLSATENSTNQFIFVKSIGGFHAFKT
jgi:hypothetical protein